LGLIGKRELPGRVLTGTQPEGRPARDDGTNAVGSHHHLSLGLLGSQSWPENDFTNRNTTFMTWNLMHMARVLKDRGGIPAHGNQRSAWDAGSRFDFENPEYR
jgi:hypothetical protein